MFVGMWMTRHPVTVERDTPVSEAAVLMSRRRLRHLPVVRGRQLVGIVSAHDVARAYPPDLNPFSAVAADRWEGPQVGEIMTTAVRTVTPDTAIEEAARLFTRHRVGALPVVSGQGLVGLLSELDVLVALREILGGGEPGVRVTFDVSEGDDAIDLSMALARQHRLRVESVVVMRHEGRRLAVVRLSGENGASFVADLWRSGHRVLSVQRTGDGETSDAAPAPEQGRP